MKNVSAHKLLVIKYGLATRSLYASSDQKKADKQPLLAEESFPPITNRYITEIINIWMESHAAIFGLFPHFHPIEIN